MTKRLYWLIDNNKLLLYGELIQDCLIPLWNACQETMKNVNYIDLGGISQVDTAGVALLIHFIALGRKNGINTTILNVSKDVLSFAKLYNLPKNVLPSQ